MPRHRPPSVDRLARELANLGLPQATSVRLAREAISGTQGEVETPDPIAAARGAAEALLSSRLRRVINATGVLLHTNLGRAPWSTQALDDAAISAEAYVNLEFDTRTGNRGNRGSYVSDLLTELTDAQSAMVVNNNAAALFLTLAVLGRGGETVVSRGELIEIGGSYRLPDLMAASGTLMVEVGTTNRTRGEDYQLAATADTRLLLKVHRSNYEITGFTEEAGLSDLAALAANRGLPFVFDAGSGLLDAHTPWLDEHPPSWLSGEPGIRQSLKAGADLVMFSGDKLLGGPQTGIIVGNSELIQRLQGSPIARALRVDGPTLAALTATLEAYADRRESQIPIWRMATISREELIARTTRVLGESGAGGRIIEGLSPVGGGSAPQRGIPSPVIELESNADSVFAGLLSHHPPIVTRRVEGRVVIDLRTVEPEDDSALAEAIVEACRS